MNHWSWTDRKTLNAVAVAAKPTCPERLNGPLLPGLWDLKEKKRRTGVEKKENKIGFSIRYESLTVHSFRTRPDGAWSLYTFESFRTGFYYKPIGENLLHKTHFSEQGKVVNYTNVFLGHSAHSDCTHSSSKKGWKGLKMCQSHTTNSYYSTGFGY